MSKKVRRAWAVGKYFKSVHRVLVDDNGFVFYPGDAWRHGPREHDRLVFLPGELAYNDWFDGWWTSNWKNCPEWVWCYGMYKRGEVR